MAAAGQEVKQLAREKVELKVELDAVPDLNRENERLKWEAKAAQDDAARARAELDRTRLETVPALKEALARVEGELREA